MKNEIIKLNLLYGVTISNIISNYEDFKRCDLLKISNSLNNYFCWLEKLNNVNSFNVVKIGKILIDNKDIRTYIINNDKKLFNKTETLLSKINFLDIEEQIFIDSNMYIDYSTKYENNKNKDNIKEFMYNELSKSNLIFKDLIMLLLENFQFSNNIFSFRFSKNYHLGILNKLNYMYYNLENFLSSTRENLYYCSLHLLENQSINRILYPKNHLICFDKYNCNKIIAEFIFSIIIKGLHFIYPYYYIEFFDYNYNNFHRSINCYKSIKDKSMFIFDELVRILSVNDKILLFKLANVNSNYIPTQKEMLELDNLIISLKKMDNIFIISQKLTNEEMKLIQDSIIYIDEYTQANNIKIINFIYNKQNIQNQAVVEFYINFNDFDYHFTIKKIKGKLFWSVYLKRNKIYKINVYLKDDFKHIYQAILKD